MNEPSILLVGGHFRRHENSRHAALRPRLPSVEWFGIRRFDVWGLRGIQYRLEEKILRNRVYGPHLRVQSRRYACLWATEDWQPLYWEGPVIFDDDDPEFTSGHIARLNLPNVRVVVTTTDALRVQLLNAGLRKPCVVIPSGVDISTLDPKRVRKIGELLGRTAAHPVVGFAAPRLFVSGERAARTTTGRLRDVSFLLEVMRRVWASMPTAELWLLGSPSVRLRFAVRREPRVRLLGYISPTEILPTIANLDIAAYPRELDLGGRMSIKVLQSLACGVPVVATDVGEAAPIRESGAGLITSGLESFADAIIDLLRDQGERRRMADRGRHYAAAYSWEVSAKQYSELFSAYIGTRRESGEL